MRSTIQIVARHRALLQVLTGREIKARYRGSLLGFLWSLVHPLLLLMVYGFVFSFVFVVPRAGGTSPYALFLVTGLFPWLWVSSALLEGANSISANSGLIRKSVFPTEILPLVPVLSNLVNFLLALPIIAGGFLVGRLLGYPVGGWPALLLPLIVALQLPYVGGLALGLAALAAHFKDVRDLLSNLLTLLFFLTPIIYPLSMIEIESLRWLVRVNPMSPYFIAYQQILFFGQVPSPLLWLHMAALSCLAWWCGSWIFERLRETLAEAV